jgi:hypothetical protein
MRKEFEKKFEKEISQFQNYTSPFSSVAKKKIPEDHELA